MVEPAICIGMKYVYVYAFTILPNVMRPTRAVGGMRLRESCRDSWIGVGEKGGGDRGGVRGEKERVMCECVCTFSACRLSSS